jgi:hypothetical protein
MSKKEILLFAAMGLLMIFGVAVQWGGTAEIWLGIAFLSGIGFGFLARTLPSPFWVFKGSGASRTWCLVILYFGLYSAVGYNVARQPASTQFVVGLKGDLLTPYVLAGVASFLGLVVSLIELPSGLSRFFRTHWPSMVFVCVVVVVLLYVVVRGVLY